MNTGYNFTQRVRRVLELSREEAERLQHEYVGTEHLLLGLLSERKGLGGEVLHEAGVTLELARAETMRVLGPSTSPRRADRDLGNASPESGVSISLRVTTLLTIAHEEAVDRETGGIDADHVMLAMLRSGQGAGVAILENLDVDIEPLRDKLSSAIPRGHRPLVPEARVAEGRTVAAMMEFALEEAELNAAPELGTHHLLIAVLRAGSSQASALLTAAGITLERARAEARRISG